jgi:hypothetical protein
VAAYSLGILHRSRASSIILETHLSSSGRPSDFDRAAQYASPAFLRMLSRRGPVGGLRHKWGMNVSWRPGQNEPSGEEHTAREAAWPRLWEGKLYSVCASTSVLWRAGVPDSGQRVILNPTDFPYGLMSPRQLIAAAHHVCRMNVLPVSACLSCLS